MKSKIIFILVLINLLFSCGEIDPTSKVESSNGSVKQSTRKNYFQEKKIVFQHNDIIDQLDSVYDSETNKKIGSIYNDGSNQITPLKIFIGNIYTEEHKKNPSFRLNKLFNKSVTRITKEEIKKLKGSEIDFNDLSDSDKKIIKDKIHLILS